MSSVTFNIQKCNTKLESPVVYSTNEKNFKVQQIFVFIQRIFTVSYEINPSDDFEVEKIWIFGKCCKSLSYLLYKKNRCTSNMNNEYPLYFFGHAVEHLDYVKYIESK